MQWSDRELPAFGMSHRTAPPEPLFCVGTGAQPLSGSHAIEMVFVFIAIGHAGSSARSFMLSGFFFKTLGLRSGSISGH